MHEILQVLDTLKALSIQLWKNYNGGAFRYSYSEDYKHILVVQCSNTCKPMLLRHINKTVTT